MCYFSVVYIHVHVHVCTCTYMYMYLHVYYICTWSVCTCIIHVHEMYDLIFLYACLVTTTLDTSVAHSLALSVHAAKALVVAVVFVCIRLHFGSNYSVRCVSKVYLTWPEPSIILLSFIFFNTNGILASFPAEWYLSLILKPYQSKVSCMSYKYAILSGV